MYFAYLICIVIFLIFALSKCNLKSSCSKTDNLMKQLSGFWSAPASFLMKSGSESIILYMEQSSKTNRHGYLVIQGAQGLVVNDGFMVQTDVLEQKDAAGCIKLSFDIEVDDDEREISIPTSLNAEFYPDICKLILYDDDTAYAVLYKDQELCERAFAK
jgi:hypothetical protein